MREIRTPSFTWIVLLAVAANAESTDGGQYTYFEVYNQSDKSINLSYYKILYYYDYPAKTAAQTQATAQPAASQPQAAPAAAPAATETAARPAVQPEVIPSAAPVPPADSPLAQALAKAQTEAGNAATPASGAKA